MDFLFDGFAAAFAAPNLLALLIGTVIGLVVGVLPGLGPMGLLTYRDEPGLTLTGHTRTVASLEFSERFLVTGCQVCMRYPCTPA